MTEAPRTATRDEGRPIYVYIAGRGHSGSTLLTLLLGRHERISSMGEVANLSLQCYRDHRTRWPGLCSCGERPFDCPVWSTVIDDIKRDHGKDLQSAPFSWRVSDVGLEEEFRRKAIWRTPVFWASNKAWRTLRHLQYSHVPVFSPMARAWRPQTVWVENRCYVGERIAAYFGTDAVVDASKDYLGMRDIAGYSPLPVRILFMTRDPRGNVWSSAKRARSSIERGLAVRKGIQDWNVVNGRAFRLLQDVPQSRWMHLRYEDLCREPQDVLRRVMEFIGLPYSDAMLDGDDDNQHTIAGNKIRLSKSRLEIREDFAWRDNLVDEELQKIRESCSALADHLGYEL